MKFLDGRGIRTAKWYANEIFRADDVDTMIEFAYTNFTNQLAVMADCGINNGYQAFVLSGLRLTFSATRTFTLKAGIAVSFAGRYFTDGAFGYTASSGEVFSVFVPEDVSVGFDAGEAGGDRRDTLEIRPKMTDYDQKARQFKDPVTGLITSALTNISTHFSYEFQIVKGTAGSPNAPNQTDGWIKIAEVLVPTSATTLTQDNMYDVDEYTCWTTGTTTPVSRTSELKIRGLTGSIAPGNLIATAFGSYYNLSGNSFQNVTKTLISSVVQSGTFLSRVGGTYKRIAVMFNSASTGNLWILDYSTDFVEYLSSMSQVQTSGNCGKPLALTTSVLVVPAITASSIHVYRVTLSSGNPTTISVGGSSQIEAVAGYYASCMSSCPLDTGATNKTFIVAYNTISQAKVVCGIDTAGTITFGTPVNVGSGTDQGLAVLKMDTSHFIVANSAGDLYIGTVSGTTISLGSAISPQWGGGSTGLRPRLAWIDALHFAIFWMYSSSVSKLTIGTIDPTYTTISYSTTDIGWANTVTNITDVSDNTLGTGLVITNDGNVRNVWVKSDYSIVVDEERLAEGDPSAEAAILMYNQYFYVQSYDKTGTNYPYTTTRSPLSLVGVGMKYQSSGTAHQPFTLGVKGLVPRQYGGMVTGLAVGVNQKGNIVHASEISTPQYVSKWIGRAVNRGMFLLD